MIPAGDRVITLGAEALVSFLPMTADAGTAETIVALTTCGDRDEAGRIARKLVGDRLAACVNIVSGVDSVYRWKDDVEEDREALLVIKTSRQNFEALAAAIRAESSYELPELLAVPVVAGSEEYLSWISSSVEAT